MPGRLHYTWREFVVAGRNAQLCKPEVSVFVDVFTLSKVSSHPKQVRTGIRLIHPITRSRKVTFIVEGLHCDLCSTPVGVKLLGKISKYIRRLIVAHKLILHNKGIGSAFFGFRERLFYIQAFRRVVDLHRITERVSNAGFQGTCIMEPDGEVADWIQK